jgi:anti-sigma B factor antagonist
MVDINLSQDGPVDVIQVRGELDMSNVGELSNALKTALSDDTSSCLLDISGLDFLDSTVIKTLVRWSNEVQLSQREALAICVGQATPAARLMELVGLNGRLPIFASRAGAQTALLEGQRSRSKRSLEWLTDAELHAARADARATADAAKRRLEDITAEERRRDE